MDKSRELVRLENRIYAHREKIERRLRLRGISEDEVVDLAVKVMLSAVTKAHQLRDETKLCPWLMKIADNCCNAYYRERNDRWRREVSREIDPITGDEMDIYEMIPGRLVAEENIIIEEDIEYITSKLSCLNEKEKRVMILHDFEGYKFREISDKLGANENTLRAQHKRAIDKLKKTFL